MNSETRQRHSYGFLVGLMAGTMIGGALAMWLAPSAASELRERVGQSARTLGKRASRQYRETAGGIGDAVHELAKKGQAVRDDIAEAVARGADEVERQAKTVNSDRNRPFTSS